MKLSLVQYNPAWENKESNKEKILSLLTDNCRSSLIIFPEMSLTGFTMKAGKYAEDLKESSFYFFSKIAQEYGADVLCGIIEKSGNAFYNTLLYIDSKGELKDTYRKIHPSSYSSEDKNYTAGSSPVITSISGWKTGLSICYDLRFPELYRKYGKERVSLIVNIANWPDTRIEHWRTLLKARAIENQCYVAGVNRTGTDPKLTYIGYSSVFDPMGKELVTLHKDEGIISAEISGDYVDEVRTKLPFLNDMVLI